MRTVLLVFAILLASGAAAGAAPRMMIGFYDDNSFRWSPAAQQNLLAAQRAGASIIHVTADWSQIAPTKPANPLNGNDPAYRIKDLDTLVDGALRYGLGVMINVSGCPKWANGGQASNHPPTSVTTLSQFVEMLARRYNGHNGHGLVSRWSVWNEPNLQLFLTPQFSGSTIVSPREYLRLYLAAYRAIKRGNPQALVAVGETSNRGRNKPIAAGSGVADTVAPATFAYQLSRLDPHLPFDAWATHPYPTDPFLGPTQKVAWPNVTLTRIDQFGQSLEKWFHRRVPIWITEYGEQTKPQFAAGVTYARQASDAKTALTMAAASPYVEMFVWFTIRDSPGTWQSGLETKSGSKKPSYAAFASVAKKLDGQSQVVAPNRFPLVKVFTPFIAYHDPAGAVVLITYRVYKGSKLVFVAQETSRLNGQQQVPVNVKFKPARKTPYLLTVDIGDKHGQHEKRAIALLPA
ncbi:MAG TPA: cellulase family glycosylhydrolase [Gaiellaceae bacterium]|nr:cellulase family glycosylhydrolase [Gaiellaceae bacterium]